MIADAARSSGWRDAGINANLDVDRSVRDAEVLFEDANRSLIGLCRDRLFAGTRYVDHRDTPALGETPRALSLVAYLNDDFGGGATVFTDPDITVSPRTGNVVIFSPVLLHQAQPVTAGTKYVITAWYHVPPPA